jgi:hypothetical protein
MGCGSACQACAKLAHMGADGGVIFAVALLAMIANSATTMRMLGEGFI